MRRRSAVSTAVSRLSPAGRRWRALLASCDLDPDGLGDELTSPSDRDFIICGSPRSGTTLVAAMLYQPPRCVTVMEPWDGLRLPPPQLFSSLRQELSEGRLARGKLAIDELTASGLVKWTTDGEHEAAVQVNDDVLVGVKWPGFWRYLEYLPDTRFLVCIRDPVEVIASYRKAGGRLAQGYEYDVAFHAAMNRHLAAATDDPTERQVLLHDYITERILAHVQRPNVLTVRYERWFAEPQALLAEIGEFLGERVDRPLAKLHPEPPDHGLDQVEVHRIRALCRTAGALGYEAVGP